MADEIFTPFTPGTAPVPTAPVETPAVTPAAKTPRRSRRAAAQPPAAPEATPAAPEAPAQPRRRRASTGKPRTPAGIKLPINMMLSVMGGLKSDDGPLFEKLLGILNGAGKGQRERVLAALEKVFS